MTPTESVWWQHGVVYQVYPRSFADTNGDGVGDLAGVTARLEYLSRTLGVDALWLSPFYPSPMADFGYDVSDHTDVDPLFGDLAGFDALVNTAHAQGLQVIVDFVPNHTSDQHRWFKAARSARNNPYHDWYIWADPKPDGSAPNNWLSVFGGPAWEWEPALGQYYLHSFLKEQPDVNWRNPGLKTAMFDVLRFWMERGVDGFRIDAVPPMLKDPALRDNPPRTTPELRAGAIHKPMGEFDSQIHLYDRAHPDLHVVFRELRQLLDSYSGQGRPRVAIGEVHEFDWAEWARYYGQLDELHLPFNFGLLSVQWKAQSVQRVVHDVEAALPEGAWPNYVLGNHDEPRLASRIGLERTRAAMLLLLTLRGTPTLYYGDELGMQDVAIPPAREQDPFGLRVPGFGLGRDPERTPMQWDASPNAGFCPSGVEPWLPLADDWAERNVAAQLADEGSILNLTRRLLRLRRELPALAVGSYQALDGAADDCLVYLREREGQRVLVAINFAAEPRSLRLADLGSGTVLLATHTPGTRAVDLRALDLQANEGCIVQLAR